MLLSIIIPVYNVEKYIKKCLDLILIQKNMIDVEILCIDDGSTDSSGNICDLYGKIDNRIKVFHKKNEGVAATRNFGLNKSKGDYIAWIDPDDYITNDWYLSIEPLLKKNIDIIFFDYIILKNKKNKRINYYSKSQFIEKENFLEEVILDEKMKSQLWHKIYKRELMKNIIFPNIKVMEDYMVLPKLILKSNTIYYLAKAIYVYRIREDSLTKDVNFEKSYMYYINAKKRYKWLLNKKIKVFKLGYLKYALSMYVQYLKIKREHKKNYKKIFIECKNELDKNKKEMILIMFMRTSKITKIKFMLYYLNLLKIFLYFR